MRKIKTILMSSALLIGTIGQADATILSQSCTQVFANPEGFYDPIGYDCYTSTSYLMEGTATVSDLDSNLFAIYQISGTLTQQSTIFEGSDGTSNGDVQTQFSFTLDGFGTYAMNTSEFFLDGGGAPDTFSETFSNPSIQITPSTLWNIWSNGTDATMKTLDSDFDGLSGINLSIPTTEYPYDNKPMVADINLTATVVPVPAAVWLFGSGLLAIFGLSRRKLN